MATAAAPPLHRSWAGTWDASIVLVWVLHAGGGRGGGARVVLAGPVAHRLSLTRRLLSLTPRLLALSGGGTSWYRAGRGGLSRRRRSQRSLPLGSMRLFAKTDDSAAAAGQSIKRLSGRSSLSSMVGDAALSPPPPQSHLRLPLGPRSVRLLPYA